jgi:signal transduction histidine kinase
MLWYRSAREPELIYGAQLNLSNIVAGLQPLIRLPETLDPHASAALLNDTGKVRAGRSIGDRAFVISEIGHVLPHWKIGVYLKNPEMLARNATTVRLVLTLSVVAMLVVIATGSALAGLELKRQLAAARQKTDFVSNVSHEFKTPLTSIRMFSELLSEGKVIDESQRKQFLQIINTEAARLTRLINNVLDFARMERGEKQYHFARCDLRQIVRDTVALYRPQLEANGFSIHLAVPDPAARVNGDCDALAQVLVNLISNAEKYAASGSDLTIRLTEPGHSTRRGEIELRVEDRGPGVPRGSEEKIFEQFYRADDSLSSGIQGSGLGLTLARQIARAHGGEMRYEPRPGGGSSFVLTLPAIQASHENEDPDR